MPCFGTLSSCPDVIVTWDNTAQLTPWTLRPETVTAWTLWGNHILVTWF